jgi:hypothetical protein
VVNPSFVSVQLRCRCGSSRSWCVRVDRTVPGPLRCQPGGGGGSGGGGSGIECGQCGHACFPSVGAFESAVRSAVDRGWGRHIQAGAVVVEC